MYQHQMLVQHKLMHMHCFLLTATNGPCCIGECDRVRSIPVRCRSVMQCGLQDPGRACDGMPIIALVMLAHAGCCAAMPCCVDVGCCTGHVRVDCHCVEPTCKWAAWHRKENWFIMHITLPLHLAHAAEACSAPAHCWSWQGRQGLASMAPGNATHSPPGDCVMLLISGYTWSMMQLLRMLIEATVPEWSQRRHVAQDT